MATRKKPQDHKMVRHPKSEKFVFEVEGEGAITVPFIENIPFGVIEDFRGLDEEEAMRHLFDALMDEESTRVRRAMTIGELMDFMEEWNEQSSISLGEL